MGKKDATCGYYKMYLLYLKYVQLHRNVNYRVTIRTLTQERDKAKYSVLFVAETYLFQIILLKASCPF